MFLQSRSLVRSAGRLLSASILLPLPLLLLLTFGATGPLTDVATAAPPANRAAQQQCQRDCVQQYDQDRRACQSLRGQARAQCMQQAQQNFQQCRSSCVSPFAP
jgi:hypothetical protein